MATSSAAQFEKAWAQVIAKAWNDESYRQKVEMNPAQALADLGIDIPAGLIIRVNGVGNATDNSVMVLPFPPRPSNIKAGSVTPEQVLGGDCCSSSLVSSSCCP